jgi:hypothetical protein
MPDLRKDLLRQMRELRARLDPKVIERANLAVFGKVPFDRDNARAAVTRFLDTRDDDGAFRDKLESALRQEGVDAEAALTPPEPPKPTKPFPLKPRRIGRIV